MRPLATLALVSFAAGPPADAFDEALWARLLDRHTVAVDDLASTRVDYGALRASADWEALLASLRASDPGGLATREERLAFWIDTYNVLAIDLVRRHYPVDGIRALGSLFSPVWKRPAGDVGGRSYSLDEIEHGILRPLGEPRVHGAIVCASLSCPPLRREPYRAADLDAQLDDNMRRWLADPRKGMRIQRRDETLWLSPIFDWFAEDFGDVVGFVARFANPADASWLREHRGTLRIRHFDYDWSLNDVRRRPGAAPAAQVEQRHATPRALAGTRSRTSGRSRTSKHQQRACPATRAQAFGSPQRGHRAGSTASDMRDLSS
jgi:hypothetical protein